MIVEILEDLEADQIQTHTRNIQCCCFMSLYRKAHRFGQDRRPSMGISIDSSGSSVVHCFSCRYSAPLVAALIDLEEKSGRDLSEVIAKAKSFERLDPDALIRSVQMSDKKEEKEVLIDENELEQYPPGYHPKILQRGIKHETLQAWGARWDAQYKRVMFPVRNFEGHLVGGVGRTMVTSKVKYFNYFHFDKSRYLFGEHMTTRDRPVVIVEGQLDAILLWQYFQQVEVNADVVALAGANASRHQLTKIVRNWEDVVLFLDNDFVGWEGTKDIARAIQHKVLLKAVTYPTDGGDPADLIQQGIDAKAMYESASLAMTIRSKR
jgi:DNA primase